MQRCEIVFAPYSCNFQRKSHAFKSHRKFGISGKTETRLRSESVRVHRRSVSAAVRKILLTRISKRWELCEKSSERGREREREREREKGRARVARKWSSFGDSRYRAGEKSGCQSSLILFLLFPPLPLRSPVRPPYKTTFLAPTVDTVLRLIRPPCWWRSFSRVGCLARQGSRKEGCGEMCLGGAVHPWRQHGPRKGGKKGVRRVRRVRVGDHPSSASRG